MKSVKKIIIASFTIVLLSSCTDLTNEELINDQIDNEVNEPQDQKLEYVDPKNVKPPVNG